MGAETARLHATHATMMSRDEARQRIESYLSNDTFLTEVLHTTSWTEDHGTTVLHAGSIFGAGCITLADGSIEIDLQLSLLGQAARSKITALLSSALLQLLTEPPER